MKIIHQNLVKNLRQFFAEQKMQYGVVGLSGGIDSALTAKIAVDALGNENIITILMPAQLTSKENLKDAKDWAKTLDIKAEIVEIESIIEQFRNFSWRESALAEINIAPRVRMMILYHFANTHPRTLVLGTSNKSEIRLGYGTKWGDFAGDVEVLGSLWKTEVYELSQYLKLPKTFLIKPPTAELHPDQTDEAELGASYEKLDTVLQKIEAGNKDDNDSLTQLVIERIAQNAHKTKLPFVIAKS